jgi:hypothetical protein
VATSVNLAKSPSGTINGGTNVTFTATPTNCGTTPTYQWKKNNANVGTNQATYADAGLSNGDVVTCVVAPSVEVCALPATNVITLSVTGAALNLDGDNDHIALPNSLTTAMTSPTNTALSIEYWFKGSSIQSVVRLQSGSDFVLAGWLSTSGPFKHAISTDGGLDNGILVGAAATNGSWHHVAMTWKRNTANGFKSYLDGV